MQSKERTSELIGEETEEETEEENEGFDEDEIIEEEEEVDDGMDVETLIERKPDPVKCWIITVLLSQRLKVEHYFSGDTGEKLCENYCFIE